jgi:hypothetical protein
MKEYRVPHFPQNPRSRVNALSHFEQNRLLSGTFGSSRICFSGSADGSSGSAISPAPNCVRELREVDRRLERRDPVRDAGDEPVLALIPDDRETFIAAAGDAAAVLTLV